MKNLNQFDYIVIICMAGFGIRGLMRGIMKELFTLGGTIGGIILARMFGPGIGIMLLGAGKGASDGFVRTAVGFVVVFLAVMFAAQLLARVTRKIIRYGGFGWADRALGMLFGVLLGIIIPGLILYLITSVKGSLSGTIFENAALTPLTLKVMKLISGVRIGI